MSLKISDNGINLIKKFEGCRLKAYKDAVGVWTIGYGHTKGVYSGQTISMTQATEYLRQDCANAERNVNSFNSKYHWTQNEFDALVSFAFNIGSINQLTANGKRSKTEISNKFTQYSKAGGKTLQGLLTRRKAEKALFDKDYSATSKNSSFNQTNGNSIIKLGQQHANNFAQCGLVTDGVRGAKTRKAAVKVIQKALNLDYKAGIKEDGVWGKATEKAFGNHYVAVGEIQYLVTAFEILNMLKGIDCGGVECPGKFGDNLANASGVSKAYKDTFKSLVS